MSSVCRPPPPLLKMDAMAAVAVLLFCVMIGLFALAQQLVKTQKQMERVVENARLSANFHAEQFQRLYSLIDDVNEKLDDEKFLTEQQLEELQNALSEARGYSATRSPARNWIEHAQSIGPGD